MNQTNFLVLISAKAADRTLLQKIQTNLSKIDFNSKPLWFDDAHAGFFISSDLVAHAVWTSALEGIPKDSHLRDMLVLELGSDFAAHTAAKTTGWLQSHGLRTKAA